MGRHTPFFHTKSIRRSLILRITALGFAIFSIYLISQIVADKQRIDREHARTSESIGNNLSQSLKSPLWDYNLVTIGHILEATMNEESVSYLAVHDNFDKRLVALKRVASGSYNADETFTAPELTETYPIYYREDRIGSVSVAISREKMVEAIWEKTQALLITALLLIIVIIVALYWNINSSIISPLEKISLFVNKITEGDLNTAIPKLNDDEIGRLSQNIENMRLSLLEKTDALIEARNSAVNREQFINKLIKNSSDIIQIISADGVTIYISESIETLLGYRVEDRIGTNTLDDVHPEDYEIVSETLKELTSKKKNLLKIEYRYRNVHGEWRYVETIFSNYLHDQIINGVVLNIRDISDRKKYDKERELLKEQLHQSQKMEAIGQLAGGVAHDFNNSLSGIMGAVEILIDKEQPREEEMEYLQLILTAVERAAQLTGKLLTFSRKGEKTSSAIDCLSVISDTTSLLRHTIPKNIEINTDNRSNISTIIGDDALLQNALMNLGINASHAMPEGGELLFTLENCEIDEEYCKHSPFNILPGNYLEISVRDSGTGMPPEILSHIFEPFFTTKAVGKGTGLGMAAVYGIVREHNGAITVYSEVGRGTVFHIYLPVSNEIKISSPVPTLPKKGSGTILVIDDEELIRITASTLLKSLGYTVVVAENGLKGIEQLQNSQTDIDLVILDMIMPVMSGRETFKKLRKIQQDIPIIIASGFSKEEDLMMLKKQGVNGFLNKPFRKAELANMVMEILKQYEAGS